MHHLLTFFPFELNLILVVQWAVQVSTEMCWSVTVIVKLSPSQEGKHSLPWDTLPALLNAL